MTRRAGARSTTVQMFPASVIAMLRDLTHAIPGNLSNVADKTIAHLLTTIFFAGLETYEGEHHAIRVAFLGSSAFNFVIPEEPDASAVGFYQWKVMPFSTRRPFEVNELVKLAVAGAHIRIYSAVQVLGNGTLAITGLAREGLNADADPFIKIFASKPGSLDVRSGRALLLRYERGTVFTGGEHLVFSVGPIRRALEATGRSAGLAEEELPDYLNAVQSVIAAMAAHRRGGIIVVSNEEAPGAIESATYRMLLDSSMASLIRLAHQIDRTGPPASGPAGSAPSPPARADARLSFAQLLRGAFLSEVDRAIEELGALSGIDGAVLLTRDLALAAFGVILPVGHVVPIARAINAGGQRYEPLDFGGRGTRHRAAATYAFDHPGSVVFVASEDGQVSCLYRDVSWPQVRFWRLTPSHARA